MNAEDRELFDGMAKAATFYRDEATAALEKIDRIRHDIEEAFSESGDSMLKREVLSILQEEN
jgi:hypothetical protein